MDVMKNLEILWELNTLNELMFTQCLQYWCLHPR